MTHRVTSPVLANWMAACSGSRHDEQLSPGQAKKMTSFKRQLARIRPELDGSDKVWVLWLRTPRGRPTDWGDYRETKDLGEVESHAEFLELWRAEFPDPIQWWRLSVREYDGQWFVSLGDLQIAYTPAHASVEGLHIGDREGRLFLGWLVTAAAGEVRKTLRNPDRYKRELERTMPLRKRFGVVQRRVLWDAVADAYRPDEELGPQAVADFERLVRRGTESRTYDTLTLNEYLRACSIAYGIGAYSDRLRPKMAPRKQYEVMADGRSDGLLDIAPKDPEALAEWYAHGRAGGHPFEICRGGNSTHITLGFLKQDRGWQFYLEGGSTSRMVETAKMALALDREKVLFHLERGEEMVLKLRGEDMVGIVPPEDHGAYAGQLFPKERQVFDTITIDHVVDEWDQILPQVRWLPIEVTCEPSSHAGRGAHPEK